MKRHNLQLGLAATLLALLAPCLTACGDDDPDSNKPDTATTTKPEVKVSDGDWQMVPTSGGTIESGDIVLTFPKGAFDKDAEVAITETSPGKVIGSGACSKFYQVVLPADGTRKDFTLSVDIEGTSDNVVMVARMPGYCLCSGEVSSYVFPLDTKVAGGKATTTIPLMLSDGEEKPHFIVGLIEGTDVNTEADAPATRAGGVKYNYDLKWSWEIVRSKYKGYDGKIEAFMHARIPFAFDKLKAAKFAMPSETVKYVIEDYKEDTWGDYVSNKWSKVGYIRLKGENLLNYIKSGGTNTALESELNKTLIHESTHAIQDIEYDPRWNNFNKNLKNGFGDEWSMLSEAIGSWSEKLSGDGLIGSNSTEVHGNVKSFMTEFFPHKMTGVDFNNSIWVWNWSPRGGIYREHGYGMGLFIEWLSRKTSNNNIVELYQYQKEGSSSVRDAFKKFLKNHNLTFFNTKDYWDFAFSVLDRQFDDRVYWFYVADAYSISNTKGGKLEADVYNYGVSMKNITIKAATLKDIANKTINVAEENEGCLTRVYYAGDKMRLILIGEATLDNPVSITVADFCKKYGYSTPNDYKDCKLITATTRTAPTEDLSSVKSKLTVSFEDAEAGIAEVILDGTFYATNPQVEDGTPQAILLKFRLNDPSTFTVTKKGKGLHVACKATDKDNAEAQTDMSFDIDDASAIGTKKAKLQNFKFSDRSFPPGGWIHHDLIRRISITELSMNAASTWYGTVAKGMKVTDFAWSDTMSATMWGETTTDTQSYTYVSDSRNEFKVTIKFQ